MTIARAMGTILLVAALAVTGTDAVAAPGAPSRSAPSLTAPSPAATKIIGTVLGDVTCASAGSAFRDVSAGSARCDDILWMAQAGIAWGKKKFVPRTLLTRGALAELLYRVAHPQAKKPTCTKNLFPDVKRGHSKCGEISWAVAAKIMDPGAQGRFRPGARITRADLAEAMYRFAQRDTKRVEPRCVHTRGVRNTNPRCGVIAWSVANKVAVRTKKQLFHPNALVNRSEAARTVHNLVARTDAAPELSPELTVPLAGAAVYVTAADDAHRVYTGHTGRLGRFSVRVPAGEYRVCVEGSAVRTGARAGYRDACAGDITWPADEPAAPVEAELITAPASGLTISLPRLAKSAAGRRGTLPTVTKTSSSYTFLTRTTPPAAYSQCQPVGVVINFDGAPAGSDVLVMQALRQTAAATGLRFIYEGTTTESAGDANRSDYQPTRYGKRWAPVLVSWATAAQVPDLAGTVIGVGGSTWRVGRTDKNRTRATYTSGIVTLDGPDFERYVTYSDWDGTLAGLDATSAVLLAVITHEFGHVVGLGHIKDVNQLMNPTAGARIDFGPGGRTGLAVLADLPCATVPLPY